ncbi:hypothetical protein JCM2811A_40440 [Methylorubrum rhodinum]
MRFVLSLVVAAVLVSLGYGLGWVASYHLGDHGDVESALLSVLTVPLGVIIGAVSGAILLSKQVGPRLPPGKPLDNQSGCSGSEVPPT